MPNRVSLFINELSISGCGINNTTVTFIFVSVSFLPQNLILYTIEPTRVGALPPVEFAGLSVFPLIDKTDLFDRH